MNPFARCCLTGILAWTSTQAGIALALPDGLYAVWETNHGNMTGELFYVEAPMTVANFVGLAEGTKTWVEEGTGRLRNEPYYDGQVVIRIADIPSTIVQTGSQNETNSGGGPGYTFRDEFHPSLRHDGFGMLSSANSGKNSNGTQYFFTTDSLAHLDDVHNVFGRIVGGTNVLTAIANGPLTGSKPTDDVIFHHVTILRIGAAALAFDAAAQGLPVAEEVAFSITPPVLSTNDISYQVLYDRTSNTFFNTWTANNTSSYTELDQMLVNSNLTATSNRVSVALDAEDPHFVTMYKVRHPDQLFTPVDYPGLHITGNATFSFYNGTLISGTLEIQFGNDGNSGTVTIASPSAGTFNGNVTYADYTPEAYRANLLVRYTPFTPPGMYLTLDFASGGVNTFSGYMLDENNSPVADIDGDFTFSVN